MQETWVRSLTQGDPLEKEMLTRYNILAWEISWTEGSDGPIVHGGHKRVGHNSASKQQLR